MSAREPVSASTSRRLPSLDEVRSAPAVVVGLAVTAGVVAAAQGVEAPQCGDTRVDEMRAHSATMRDDLARGELAATLREAGLALGWIAHREPPGPHTLPFPTGVRGGDTASVDPAPPPSQPSPPPVVERPTAIQGGIRRVDPTPPRHPPPTVHRVQPRGGAPAHSVLPRNPVDL